jgi:hypothetical protein
MLPCFAIQVLAEGNSLKVSYNVILLELDLLKQLPGISCSDQKLGCIVQAVPWL